MESRWPNIFIQEGVWSNSVIHRDSVSTPEYCWCIASHCYACCLPIQACTSEPSFHGAKMAEYRHPGRGVVKPSDPQRQRSTPEYCWCMASHCYACCLPIQACTSEPSFHGVKMAEYLHPGRGVVKPSDPLRQCEHSRVLLVYSLTLLCMLSANTGMYK